MDWARKIETSKLKYILNIVKILLKLKIIKKFIIIIIGKSKVIIIKIITNPFAYLKIRFTTR